MSARFDLSLYLVTDPEMTARRGLVETVAAAIEGGVTMVQLRHKDGPARAMVEAGRALHALLAPRGIPLIVNDRVDVAHAIGAEGVHVGQDDLPPDGRAGDPRAARHHRTFHHRREPARGLRSRRDRLRRTGTAVSHRHQGRRGPRAGRSRLCRHPPAIALPRRRDRRDHYASTPRAPSPPAPTASPWCPPSAPRPIRGRRPKPCAPL